MSKSLPVIHLLILAGCLAPLSAAASDANVVDTVLRYVNGETVTNADLRQRIVTMVEKLQRQGQQVPGGLEFQRELMQIAMQQATEELLLEQEAQRLEIPVDRQRLRREIEEDAIREGRYPTMAEQRRELALRERQRRIQLLEHFFLARLPKISPAQIAQAYELHQEDLREPPRAHVWRIVMMPSDPQSQKALAAEATDLVFQGLAGHAHAPLAELVTTDLKTAYVAADGPAAQLAVLEPVLGAMAERAPAEPDAATQRLLERATAVLERRGGQEDAAAIREQLTALAAEIQALESWPDRLTRFQQAATRLSIVPSEAEIGGDCGMVEPGQQSEAYEQQAFSLEPYQVSPVIEAGRALALLMISESVPGRLPSLDEVRSRIRKRLEQAQEDAARSMLLRQLHDKALIRDVHQVDLDRLLPGAELES